MHIYKWGKWEWIFQTQEQIHSHKGRKEGQKVNWELTWGKKLIYVKQLFDRNCSRFLKHILPHRILTEALLNIHLTVNKIEL